MFPLFFGHYRGIASKASNCTDEQSFCFSGTRRVHPSKSIAPFSPFGERGAHSGEQIFNQFTTDIGQALEAATVVVGQSLVIQAQEMEQRGVDVA